MSSLNLTEKTAHEEARKLAKRLNKSVGGKWKPVVWKNIWWCFKVEQGSISVYKYKKNGKIEYMAYVGSEKNVASGALAMWHDTNKCYKKPEDTIYEAMKNARKCVLELYENVSNNFDLMPKLREKMKEKELKL